MPETMTHDDLLAALNGAANKLITEEISVFDVYRGTGLPEGMKEHGGQSDFAGYGKHADG